MRCLVPLAASITLAIAGGAAAAEVTSFPGEQTVIRIAERMGANTATGVSCNDLGGPNASGYIVYGSVVRKTGAIRLNARYTCLPVIQWQRTGKFTPRALQGLVTIGHEIAHTRGVRDEARAECHGAQAALRELRRIEMPLVDLMRARRWLRDQHDTYFPPAYRLSSINCRF